MFNYESVGGPTTSDIHHSPVSASLGQGDGENHSAQNRRLSTLNSSVPSYIHFNPTANRIDHRSAKMHTCKNAKFKGSMSVRVWKSSICNVFMFDIVNSQCEQVLNNFFFHKPSMNHQRVDIMQNRKASVALLISSHLISLMSVIRDNLPPRCNFCKQWRDAVIMQEHWWKDWFKEREKEGAGLGFCWPAVLRSRFTPALWTSVHLLDLHINVWWLCSSAAAQANQLQPKALKVIWRRITSPCGGGGEGGEGLGVTFTTRQPIRNPVGCIVGVCWAHVIVIYDIHINSTALEIICSGGWAAKQMALFVQ